jgi:hypothetical protein
MTSSAFPDRPIRRAALCGLSASAAVVHACVVPEHVDESWLLGTFFAVVAAAQAAWGVAVLGAGGRALRTSGALASLALLALWLISRTIGLPVGPHPWQPEPFGAADLIAATLELGLVACVVGRPRARAAGACADISGPPSRTGLSWHR